MRKHVNLALECGFLLFLGAAAVALFWLWRDGRLQGIPAVLTLAVPAAAALLLVAASIFVPSMFAVTGLRYPLNVTLPLVYLAMIVATLVLVARSQSSIERLPDQFRVLYLWLEARALIPTLLLGFLSMTIATHRASRQATSA